MHTTSQEYLIKLLIGDSDFSFVIETIVFRLNLSLNSLFCYTFTFECKLKGLFNVAKILGYGPRTMSSILSTG